MTSSENSSNQNTDHKINEKPLLSNTYDILNEDRRAILFEVLKCDICLELPKRKQVRICEKGHHFCNTCHKKIKSCGICRGKLLSVRNFAVEQLVMKLGPILDIAENELPIKTPAKVIPGSFQCLHNCSAKVSSFNILSHLRAKHSHNLIENVICSPYTNQFSLKYNIVFHPNESYIYSAFVADLGLCTIENFFMDLNFFGYVRLLVERSDLPQYRYQLVVKVVSSQMVSEFGVSDCIVSHYSDDKQSVLKQGNLLKIRSDSFLEFINEGDTINVFFSIWKKSETVDEKSPVPSITCLPETVLHKQNNRRARRNKNRNARRKRVKAKFNRSISENSTSN